MNALARAIHLPARTYWKEEKMPTMVTGQELRVAIEKGSFVQDGDVNCVEGVKYDFRLGPRILKARYSAPIDANKLNETEKQAICVEPGEAVFVLTEERLALPNNMIAQLSPKRKLSHAGILTLGGFTIDPGYEGRLLIGLFNFSSTPFPLIPGKKIIAATFYRLEGTEAGEFPAPDKPLDDFPDELVQVMQKYHPVAIQSVTDLVKRLQDDLTSLKEEIRSHEVWYQRFKESLDAHNTQIGGIATDLKAEVEVRKSGHDQMTKAIEGLQGALSFLKGAAWVMMIILGVAFAGLSAWIGPKLLGLLP
jgi:deoxycytidine triphosphate deaminase